MGGCQVSSDRYVFQNSDVLLKAWILSLATNTVSFLLGERLTLFLLKKISARHRSLSNHSVQLFFQLRMVLPEKSGWLTCHADSCMRGCPGEHRVCALRTVPTSTPRELKRHVGRVGVEHEWFVQQGHF